MTTFEIENKIHVLGFSGSLRAGSYNTSLLRVAQELLPPGMTLEIIDLSTLPMFNQDEEKPFPQPVVELRQRIEQADALLIASPEYNASITAVLKNAIDWASRPPKPPLVGKPAAIMGASTGNFGTLRAQLHLRQVLTHVGALTLAKPEVLVARAREVFSPDGELVDQTARGFLRDLLFALAVWTQRVSPSLPVGVGQG